MSGDRTVDGPTSGPLRERTRHLFPMDAQVFAACLQNEGIAAVVMDADTISVTGAVFSALPRGGVQVMAPASHFEEADRIRAAFDSGEFAIDEDFDVGAE